jgi:hypothetical protein
MCNVREYRELNELWRDYLELAFQRGNNHKENYVFRGVVDKDYDLKPSVGRGNIQMNTNNDSSSLEDDSMREFKRLAAPVLPHPPRTEMEWLFLAQHYGLPTRLLDWSTNPLVALYFAAECDDDKDGAVYIVAPVFHDDYEKYDYKTADYTKEYLDFCGNYRITISRERLGEVIFLRPKYTDPRYLNQKSVFSCPKNPFQSLEIPGIEKIQFKGYLKSELRELLRTMGISSYYIYPGLGGIASEVKTTLFAPVQSGFRKIYSI